MSAWPGGIFSRAFVREYATAIGIAPESVLAEFARLFPEQDTLDAVPVPQATSELRMTLATDARWATTAAVSRVTIAILEVCLIVAASVAAASVRSADVWRICAAVALTYYPLSRALPGRSRVFSSLQNGFHILMKPTQIATTGAREALHLVTRSTSEATGESAEDSASAASPLRSASASASRSNTTSYSPPAMQHVREVGGMWTHHGDVGHVV